MTKYKQPKKIECLFDYNGVGTIMSNCKAGQTGLIYVSYFLNGEWWNEGIFDNGQKFKLPDVFVNELD